METPEKLDLPIEKQSETTDAPDKPIITFQQADAVLYAEPNPPLAFDDGGTYKPGDTFQFGEAKYEILSIDDKTGRYRCEGTLPDQAVKSHLYVSPYELHTMLKAAEAMPFKAEVNTLKVQNHQLAKTVTDLSIAKHDLECKLKTERGKRMNAEKQLEQVKAEAARPLQPVIEQIISPATPFVESLLLCEPLNGNQPERLKAIAEKLDTYLNNFWLVAYEQIIDNKWYYRLEREVQGYVAVEPKAEPAPVDVTEVAA